MNAPIDQPAAVGQAQPDAPTTKPRAAPNSRAIWAALFWKEWCEHRGKLLAMFVIGLPILWTLWWPGTQLGRRFAPTIYLTFAVPLAALFVSMGIAAGEQATGTIDFARRLPTPSWRRAFAKLVTAVVSASIPALLVLFLVPAETLTFLPVIVLAVTSLVLWIAVFGMNRIDEIRAAALGIAGIVVVWALFAIGCYQYDAINESRRVSPGERYRLLETVTPVVAAALPGGILIKASNGPPERTPWLWLLAAYSTTHVPLAWRWLTAYGSWSPSRAAANGATPDSKAWLAAPLASPTRAILWKQLRETLPVALAALALAAAWTIIALASNATALASLGESTLVFVSLASTCAFFAAIVAGVGLFLEDLRPGVHTFWRSRPIPPDRWFWLKYTTGLACLTLVFGSVTAAGAGVIWWTSEFNYTAEDIIVYSHGVLAFWMIYSGAVCACCLVRQPLYAAILGVGFPAILLCACAAANRYLPIPDAWVGPLLIAVIVPASIAATLTAWQAVRRDWAILR